MVDEPTNITTTAHIESGNVVTQAPLVSPPIDSSVRTVAEGARSGATGSDRMEAAVVRALAPKEAQEQAFMRARHNAGLLHKLLHNATGVADLAKDEMQQVIANLGRDLQHLI